MVVEPEFVHERRDDAEDQSVHRGLGNKMTDSDEDRCAGIFPRISPLPVENDQSFQHDHGRRTREGR